jgi:hypothetical protein
MRSRVAVRRVLAPWLLGFVAALTAVSAPAALLRNVPQTLKQPDGTVVHLFATGDEYYNRLHDGDGFTVVRDPDTGYLVYAIKADGRLQPTAFVVGGADPAAAGLEPGLKPDPWTLPDPEEIYPGSRRRDRVGALGLSNAPAFSLINNVVIFIRFSDEAAGGFNSTDSYQMWFNSTSGTSSSMQRYFLEASYNQLLLNSTFYPAPSGALVASYQDSHPRAYYKPYNASTNPIGYQTDQRNARECHCCRARWRRSPPWFRPRSMWTPTTTDSSTAWFSSSAAPLSAGTGATSSGRTCGRSTTRTTPRRSTEGSSTTTTCSSMGTLEAACCATK